MDLKFDIERSTKTDVASMVSLSFQKRRAYEKAQPQFWKYAEGAEKVQYKWFEELLDHNDQIINEFSND